MLTFEPHPRAVVAPDAAPKLLTPLPVKADLIAGLGVQELVVIPFDGAFAAQTPQEFIDDILVGTLGATKVSVGENFRFGHKAKGDVELLRSQTAFEPRDRRRWSRSTARSSPRPTSAASSWPATSSRPTASSARRSSCAAIVQHGDKRGRTLGYPTANLVPDNALCYPGNGIYACRAALEVDGEWRWWPAAATSACARPS